MTLSPKLPWRWQKRKISDEKLGILICNSEAGLAVGHVLKIIQAIDALFVLPSPSFTSSVQLPVPALDDDDDDVWPPLS